MGDYHLLCQCLYKQGDRVGEMFSVAVSPNETIATIKDLIQTQLHPEYAKEFTVPALTLWKLSNPLAFSIDDPNPQEKVDVLLERFRQNPTSVAKALFLAFVVSDYFKTTPESRSLHLIVEGPHGELQNLTGLRLWWLWQLWQLWWTCSLVLMPIPFSRLDEPMVSKPQT